MDSTRRRKALLMLICSVIIFGTIGVFRRLTNCPSGLLAIVRGAAGALFLLLVTGLRGRAFDRTAVRRRGGLLLLSGACIGVNWVLLFEACRYTTVSAATVCYYMAPVFVILVSPVLLKEKLTAVKLVCAAAAILGIVLISGVLQDGFAGLRGILCGLGAAVFYAAVMLLNKILGGVPPVERTIVQLLAAAVSVLPYSVAAGEFSAAVFRPADVALLALIGIVHTGLAYLLYFSSFDGLPAQTVSLVSYLDPVISVLLSALLLQEPLTLPAAAGAVLVLAGAGIASCSPAKDKVK